MNVILSRTGGEQGRDFSIAYDELGRTISSSIGSDEWGLVRGFAYAYDTPRGRYDGARQRYLNRKLNQNELRDNDLLVPLNDIWSDYDGDEIYGDFTIEGSTVMVIRSFEPGVARVDDPFGLAPTTEYYHGDLIGTTRDVSDGGYSTARSVYTAFSALL